MAGFAIKDIADSGTSGSLENKYAAPYKVKRCLLKVRSCLKIKS